MQATMKPTPFVLPFATALLALMPACQRDTGAAIAAKAPTLAADYATPGDLVTRGEYLVRTTGCNDCHTVGYGDAQGNLDKAQWLTGSPIGFKGPWGTTYAANLRLKLAEMDEAQWLDYSATLKTRPIMPDFAVRAMSADDRRAIYHFVKSLGPGGQPAPAYLPPDQKPQPPYFELVLPAPPPAQPEAAAGT